MNCEYKNSQLCGCLEECFDCDLPVEKLKEKEYQSSLEEACDIARGGHPPSEPVMFLGQGRPPRNIKFCWECGKRLSWKLHFAEKLIDGHMRVLHKQCAEEYE